MIRRAILLAAASAALVPFLAGPASASCLDDLKATGLAQSDATWTPSSHYYSLSYVEVTGTATVTVWGDDAIADARAIAAYEPEWAQDVVTNDVGAATQFVNCVAG